MSNNDEEVVNLKNYLSIVGLPDEIYQSCWIERNGDMVTRYTPEGTRRMLNMLTNGHKVLTEQNDPELEKIKADLEFSIYIFKHMIETVYDNWEEYQHE